MSFVLGTIAKVTRTLNFSIIPETSIVDASICETCITNMYCQVNLASSSRKIEDLIDISGINVIW